MLKRPRHDSDLLALDQALRRRLAPRLDPGMHLASSAPQLRRFKYSFYLRYRTERAGDPALLVKIQRLPEHSTLREAIDHGPELRHKSEHEYRVLGELWQLFGQDSSADHTAVRPLALLEPWGAVVTEELRARSLRSLLERRAGRPTKDLDSVFGRVGLWLRRYHRRLPVDPRPFDVDRLSAEIADCLRLVGREVGSLEPELERVGLLASAARGAVTPVAELHNDFHPDNVLVTPNRRVAALDVWPKPSDSVYLDLAMVLTQLPLVKIHQITRGALLDPEAAATLRRELLSSYFESTSVEGPLLALLCARNVAAKWRDNEVGLRRRSGLRRHLGRVTIAARRSYFRKLLQGWLSEDPR